MPKKEKQTEAKDAAEIIRYELGYHLLPLVSEEALPAEVGQIRETIERAGGVTTADQFPAARPLSYGMSRMVGGKREVFTQSHFGWMQFELPQGAIEGVKDAIMMNDRILRFLVVRTKREIPQALRVTSIVQPTEEVGAVHDKTMIATPTHIVTFSEEELDKTIDEMVIE
jgi:ribosomal protein S6